MALSRVQSVLTYRTVVGSSTYTYDIVVDASGNRSVKNIRGPRGLITDTTTSVPEVVVADIQDAMEIASLTVSESVVETGTVTFEGETELSASVTPGLLNNTNYRVAYSTPDGTLLRTSGKTTTGFTIEAPTEYGTVEDPVEVGWTVYAATYASSAFGGSVTISSADNGSKTVTFSSALTTDNYRVVLTPADFVMAKVSSQSRSGFTIELGHTLAGLETLAVGYDVFL